MQLSVAATAASSFPVVFFDAKVDRDYIRNVLQLGADAWFAKPVDTDHLVAVIEHLGGLDVDMTQVHPYLAATVRAALADE